MRANAISRRNLLRSAAALTGTALVGGVGLPAGAAGSAKAAFDPMAGDRLLGWIRQQIAFGYRRTGSPAEKKAAEWLAARMKRTGLKTTIDPYPMRRWVLKDWSVEIVSIGGKATRQPITTHPMWSTKAGSVEAELVDIGLGTPLDFALKDVKGKIVVVTGKAILNVFATSNAFGTYTAAAKAGAVGMLVDSDAPGNVVRPFSYHENALDKNPIPAFVVGSNDFVKLRSAARKGARVRWSLDAKHVSGTTRDVVAKLPGSGAATGTIMVCAHFDTWFDGALDNATGVAGMIGLAEHFAALPRAQRPKDMIFIGVTGHDTGYPHGGMKNWVEKHPADLRKLDVFVNLDHLAAHGSEHVHLGGLNVVIDRPLDEERALFTSAHPALLRAWLPALLRHRLLLSAPLPTLPILTANSDLEGIMAENGVPAVNLTMATPCYHTPEDTIDKIPAEQLSRSVSAHRDFLATMQKLSRSQIRSPL